MKKLYKKFKSTAETVEAYYSCGCSSYCRSGCGCGTDPYAGTTMYNYSYNNDQVTVAV